MAENSPIGNEQYITLAGRVVGVVNGSELVKRVHVGKHLLRSPRGWAIDAHVPSNDGTSKDTGDTEP